MPTRRRPDCIIYASAGTGLAVSPRPLRVGRLSASARVSPASVRTKPSATELPLNVPVPAHMPSGTSHAESNRGRAIPSGTTRRAKK